MTLEEAVIRAQSAYPKIYLACHTRHRNARTTPDKLSQRDGAILAHLDGAVPLAQSALARHMGLAKSTLSEALSGLEAAGYVSRTRAGRETLLLRTARGTSAMSRGSVLEPRRLRRILRALSDAQLSAAIRGIEILAGATKPAMESEKDAS